MKETVNFGLKKPEENDFYDFETQNDNLDKIDKALHECMTSDEVVTKDEVGYPSYTPQEDTINLLNPTLSTNTSGGVTITLNSDGTYLVNGTATAKSTFVVQSNINIVMDKQLKLVGCPSGGSASTYSLVLSNSGFVDYGSGYIANRPISNNSLCIVVQEGAVCDNLVFKPMLTTNLEATYDDYVPYGGYISSSNAGYHNSVYRGKYLGDAVTEAQYEAISSGSFDDLFIGDYWTIDGVNWRIAAFDYYLNTGDTAFVQHHAVIVPDTALYTYKMNDTDTTAGGYVGSKMYNEGLEQAKAEIKSAFSGHVLTHRLLLVNAVTDGLPTGSSWYDSEVELMNELMVFGSFIYGTTSDGATVPHNGRIETSQLPLFFYRHDMIAKREYYRLRDASDKANFTFVSDKNVPGTSGAKNPLGVRPSFCIG